jgi:hypothetical protein
LWKQVLIAETTNAKVDAPILFWVTLQGNARNHGGKGKSSCSFTSTEDFKRYFAFDRRYPGYVRNKYYNTLVKKTAALIIVADQEGEKLDAS